MVEIAPPPPKVLPVEPTLCSIDKSKSLVRIFDPTRHNTNALTFRYYGPLGRFDHQRDFGATPSNDDERGIYYAGFKLSCCLVEVFGDKRTIEVGNYFVAWLKLKRPLSLLDLCGSPAMANGTVSTIASIPNRELTQAWARYFYENPQIYTELDGIIYHNAHKNELSVALYERSKDALSCSPDNIMPLSHKFLRTHIRRVAQEHGLIVVEY